VKKLLIVLGLIFLAVVVPIGTAFYFGIAVFRVEKIITSLIGIILVLTLVKK